MPVIGGCDQHGIDVGTAGQFLVVVVNIFVGKAQEFLGLILPPGVDLAGGDHLELAVAVRHFLQLAAVSGAADADSDNAEIDAVIGSQDAGRTWPGGQQGPGCGQGCHSGTDKFTTGIHSIDSITPGTGWQAEGGQSGELRVSGAGRGSGRDSRPPKPRTSRSPT